MQELGIEFVRLGWPVSDDTKERGPLLYVQARRDYCCIDCLFFRNPGIAHEQLVLFLLR
jgi:hypothetical protein